MNEFNRCAVWLEAALEYSGGTHTLSDIRAGIEAKRYALIPGEKSALVFEICEYPQLKALHVFLAGGDLQEIKSFDPLLIDLAKAGNCARIDIAGRRGWVRALKDIEYTEMWTTVSKRIET